MGLNSYEINDADALTCLKCQEKEKLMVIPKPVNHSQLNDSTCPSENFTREGFLTDPGTVTLLNNDPHTQGPNSGRTFLFEKQLSATDCSRVAGRLLLPKAYAEEFLPMLPKQKKMPVVIKDTEGVTWNFNVRWWAHNKSRKYVIDGIRGCIRKMQWNAGDTLKFYRQLPGGELIMKLQRADESTSTS